MEDYEVELTQHEVTFLSDSLSIFTQGPSPESRAYPDLLLKMGAAFLEMGPSKLISCVALSRDELWMIREVAKSSVSVGPERVGLNLLTKAYKGLRRLHAEAPLHAVIAELGEKVDGTDAPTSEDCRSKLKEWAAKEV